MEIVCEPVRKYLRTRDDTVRCIVQSLIDDNTNELADELIRNEGLCLDDSFMADDLNDPEELGEFSCISKISNLKIIFIQDFLNYLGGIPIHNYFLNLKNLSFYPHFFRGNLGYLDARPSRR